MYRSKDREAFIQKGAGDSFESAGNYNLFMQCGEPPASAFRGLPADYSFRFRLCRRNELEVWKRVVAEEQYVDYVSEYYAKVYAPHEDEFFRRCLFVCNEKDMPVASTFIWRSYGQVNTVGWFRVLPEYEGKGIGRAILSEILKNAEFPVYLHTQPTSARAIKLYSDFGFKLITDPKVGYRRNELSESLPFLEKVMPEKDYKNLRFTKANAELLKAALSTEVSEF